MTQQQSWTQVAVALDELMCDPRATEIAAEVRGRIPTWLLDQTDALSAHVRGGMTRAAAKHGGDTDMSPAADHPSWVRLGALSAVAQWAAGEGATCVHSPHPQRPEPTMAAAWRPGLVVCAACTDQLKLRHNSVADRTCDGCGYVAELDAGEGGIWPNVIEVVGLMWMFGACGSCMYWTPGGAS